MSKIAKIEPISEVTVIAVKTKSGFYKTKVGMSHNCDDL
jgi:hypothetical protein